MTAGVVQGEWLADFEQLEAIGAGREADARRLAQGVLGFLISLSALVVALSAPILGAIADRAGVRKRFMGFYVAMCLTGVLAMTQLEPGMAMAGFLMFLALALLAKGVKERTLLWVVLLLSAASAIRVRPQVIITTRSLNRNKLDSDSR